jgi:hypothetical protein
LREKNGILLKRMKREREKHKNFAEDRTLRNKPIFPRVHFTVSVAQKLSRTYHGIITFCVAMHIKIISEIKLSKTVEKRATVPGPLLPTRCSGSGSGEPPRRTEKKKYSQSAVLNNT